MIKARKIKTDDEIKAECKIKLKRMLITLSIALPFLLPAAFYGVINKEYAMINKSVFYNFYLEIVLCLIANIFLFILLQKLQKQKLFTKKLVILFIVFVCLSFALSLSMFILSAYYFSFICCFLVLILIFLINKNSAKKLKKFVCFFSIYFWYITLINYFIILLN